MTKCLTGLYRFWNAGEEIPDGWEFARYTKDFDVIIIQPKIIWQ